MLVRAGYFTKCGFQGYALPPRSIWLSKKGREECWPTFSTRWISTVQCRNLKSSCRSHECRCLEFQPMISTTVLSLKLLIRDQNSCTQTKEERQEKTFYISNFKSCNGPHTHRELPQWSVSRLWFVVSAAWLMGRDEASESLPPPQNCKEERTHSRS